MSVASCLTRKSLMQLDREYSNSSSYSSRHSTSSQSSSSSSSSASSSSAKFSSDDDKQSFHSESTIVAAKPRRFGSPEYNYFWIEIQSKSNPKLSYFYNCKSHNVAWERPCPKNIALPYYKSNWNAVQPSLSDNDEDIDLMLVSSPENEVQRRKRVNIRKRNKRLMEEELDNEIEIVEVKKVTKSRRMLDTLWKLYRCPGESLEDVKRRLLDSTAFANKVKQEIDAANNLTTPIKEEVNLENVNYSIAYESLNPTIKPLNEGSDSDPENVSFLIKQEYLMNYNIEDSEEEYGYLAENCENEEPEEIYKGPTFHESELESEDSSESDDDQQQLNGEQGLVNSNNLKTYEEYEEEEINHFDYKYEAPCLFADLFEIEMHEIDTGINIESPASPIETNFPKEEIDWNFESAILHNSTLTQSVVESIYGPPKVKNLADERWPRKKRKSKKKAKKRGRSPKTVNTEPVKNENSINQPIICDMYGTRTINYDLPPMMKIPKLRDTTRLSDSSSEDSEPESSILKIEQNIVSPKKDNSSNVLEPISASEDKENNPLKLTSWFPRSRNLKRKVNSVYTDDSWHESNASCMDTDLEEFDQKSRKRYLTIKKERLSPVPKEAMPQTKRRKVKNGGLPSVSAIPNFGMVLPFEIKKEKLSPIPMDNAPIYPPHELATAIDLIKQEERSHSFSLVGMESKMPVSMTSTLLDSSVAEVEKCSPVFETDSLAMGVVIEPENGVDSDADSNPCSSNCSCSHPSSSSSGSFSSSSSSSSDDSDDDKEVAKKAL